jgi:hypothetical protein
MTELVSKAKGERVLQTANSHRLASDIPAGRMPPGPSSPGCPSSETARTCTYRFMTRAVSEETIGLA